MTTLTTCSGNLLKAARLPNGDLELELHMHGEQPCSVEPDYGPVPTAPRERWVARLPASEAYKLVLEIQGGVDYSHPIMAYTVPNDFVIGKPKAKGKT